MDEGRDFWGFLFCGHVEMCTRSYFASVKTSNSFCGRIILVNLSSNRVVMSKQICLPKPASVYPADNLLLPEHELHHLGLTLVKSTPFV